MLARAHRARALAATALASVLVLSVPNPAAAAVIEVEREHTDNTVAFKYDATTATMPYSLSSLGPISRGDPSSFTVSVRPKRDAAVGQRLGARLQLVLLGTRARRYDGSFAVVATDQDGEVRRFKMHKSFTLRPRPGYRRKSFGISFDLPSGTYNVMARFRRAQRG